MFKTIVAIVVGFVGTFLFSGIGLDFLETISANILITMLFFFLIDIEATNDTK